MNSATTYIILSALAGAGTTLLGVWAHRRRAQTEVDTKKASVAVDLNAQEEQLLIKAREAAQQALKEPMRILENELAKRERELDAIRTKDDVERAKYLETLGAMRTALEAIAKDLKEHRDEEKGRTAVLHKQLDVLDRRLLVLETKLGIAPPAAVMPPPEVT